MRFGREKSNVCGAAETTALTAAGLARADLPDEVFSWRQAGKNDAVCSTGDNLPIDTAEQVRDKLDLLGQNAQRLRSDSSAENLRWHAEVLNRTKLLYEITSSPQISRSTVLNYYAQPAAPMGDFLGGSDETEALESHCAALLHEHVHPVRIAQAYHSCLELGITLVGEQSSVTSGSHGERAAARAKDMYGFFVRGINFDAPIDAQMTTAQDLADQLTAYERAHLSQMAPADLEERRALREAYLAQHLADLANRKPGPTAPPR